MTFTPLPIGPIALPNAADTLYTVPASNTATIECLTICNEDSVDHTFTLSIGTDGTGKRLFRDTVIAANKTYVVPGRWVLTATQTIQGYADTADKVTFTGAGFTRA